MLYTNIKNVDFQPVIKMLLKTKTKMAACLLLLITLLFSPAISIKHGTSLIWAQGPRSPFLSYSKLMSIPGDPNEWVIDRSPKVKYITATHLTETYTSLGYSWRHQTLYWSEKTFKKVQSLSLNGSDIRKTHFSGTSSQVNGIAIDWLSSNLYFTDSLYDWIMMISSRPGHSAYRIVVNNGLEYPHGIVVHPSVGRLFWTDWGPIPKIETSDLLGRNRKVILQATDLITPKGLTLDIKANLLYWVDTTKSTVECVDFNGNNRKIFQSSSVKGNFYGLAVYGDFKFIMDQKRRGTGRGMLSIFHQKGVVNFKLGGPPYDVIMYDESQQPGNSSDCDDKGCEHLCVLDAKEGATCICGEGHYLNPADNTSCIASTKFVHPTHIYSVGASICQYPANMPDMPLDNVYLSSQCFIDRRQDYNALTYNARSNMLYYFANLTKTISRIPLETRGVGKVLGGGGGIVNGMAYDWVHDLLFWADTKQGIIFMCSNDCSFQTPVLERLAQPFGIAVHPERGRIYWTSQGHLPDVGPSVEMAYMDGSKREVIQRGDLGTPNHIYIDYKTDLMYWADSSMHHVRMYNLDTKRITVFFHLPGVRFYGISIFKDYLLWTDRYDQNGLHAARLDHKEKVRAILHTKFGVASDLITFDIENQPMNESNPFINPCSQIYQKLGQSNYKCACGNGYEVSTDDDTQCVTKPVYDDFLLVNDAYQRQIFQIDLRTGKTMGINVKPLYEPIALAVNPYDFKVYWSDNKAHTVEMDRIGGGQQHTMLLSNKSTCDGLAVDYINKLLFYTDSGMGIVGVASLNNYDMRTAIVSKDLWEPRDIVVHSKQGKVYWSDWGVKPSIEMASMDGSDRETLVSFNSTAWPNGISLDIIEQKLYWADAASDTISVVNLNTRKVTELLKEPGSHYFSLQVIGDYIYVSDWSRQYLVRMEKRGGSMKRYGNGRFTKMYGIQGFNSSEMFKYPSVCSSNACDHLCLPDGAGSYTCVCSDGYQRVGNTCVIVKQKTTTTESVFTLSDNDNDFTVGYPPKSSTSGAVTPVATTAATTATTTTKTESKSTKAPSPPPPASSSSSLSSLSSSSSSPPSPSSSSSTTSSSSITRSSTTTSSTTHVQSTAIPTSVISITTTKMSVRSSTRMEIKTSTDELTTHIQTSGHTDRPSDPTDRPSGHTDRPSGQTERNVPKTNRSTGKTASSGLSSTMIGVIVGCVIFFIIAVIIIAFFVRRRHRTRTGHLKLKEDSSMTDSSVVFHDAAANSISFQSGGISNPTYDIMHSLPE